jgi:hypothetical protein
MYEKVTKSGKCCENTEEGEIKSVRGNGKASRSRRWAFIYLFVYFFLLLLYWEYIVTVSKVLTIYHR